ncbi:sigma-70 family RNA polymerase sigma factor [Clostridioides difficile]|uniref:RNA polymerase sigma factor n=1 Tax=Clostridioides difficile TaxID=1496 RepID=UPI00143039F4|nr:sigma-70 family RNA polymerase sigma factor [Clostridioides difficile]EJA6848015.1 sigma-70 family RNA polymerase sigma factor [Clostridioides difficile]MCP8332083.1 sigma-70 family RNA polymerase sigma factor [Clostridioides difficile]MCP8338048.1 sigma-70 family RNA polymerase sigma factor [Clostridioides difficile]MDU8846716.1 sigma-70 family RNA polymerase sigma factor [Clostridioides difficile]NJA29034.1 sigma-70 family RNA polymerase sigma factor [Clostridioides difficile]
MKPSDFQKTIQCQFDCKLKKVVKGIVKNYQKELKRRNKKEVPFCELPEIVIENLGVFDDYDTDYTLFNVCGNDVRILDDELAEALKKLSYRNRENLLMYYFLEMSDTEIAKKQNISRSGVFQNRHNSLELMKKKLREEK